MSELKHISGSIPDLGHLFEELPGECQRHGMSVVLVRKGSGWKCPKCNQERSREAARAAWETERKELLHRIARVPQKYRGQAFKPHNDQHRAARGLAKAFFDAVVAGGKAGGWRALMLIGEPGTGKTLLACELGERLIDSALMSVRYVTAMQMLGEIKASYSHDGMSESGEIQKFVDYDLLIIDEIDLMRGSDNDRLLMNEVINRRYNDERPILVISNKLVGQLAEYVGDRVSSRLHENSIVVSFDWEDFRKTGNR